MLFTLWHCCFCCSSLKLLPPSRGVANLLSVVNEVICLRAELSLNFLPIQLVIAFLKCADFFIYQNGPCFAHVELLFKFLPVSVAKHGKQIVMTYRIGTGYVSIVVID